VFSFAEFGNDLYTGKKSFNFVGGFKRYAIIGTSLCVISLILLATLKLNPGIEFRGGSEFRVVGTSTADPGVGEGVVRGAFPNAEPPRGTAIGGDSVRIQTERLNNQQTEALREDLAKAYDVQPSAVTSSFVGPSWGQDITSKGLLSLVIFLVLVTAMITVYFRTFDMAAAALIALVHDMIITAGIYSLTGFEVTPGTLIGFLTILAYSLYDTVVVFDKVRENTDHIYTSTRKTFAEAVNLAVNQTLVRSINTSIVAVLPVASILFIGAFVLGAGTLRDISLSLFVGTLVGAFSSIFIAPGFFVWLHTKRDPRVREQAERVERARAKAAACAVPAGAVAGGGSAALAAESGGSGSGGGTAVLTADEDEPRTPARTPRTAPTSGGGQRNQPKRKSRGKKR
jgi:preprotein translocase subunit SecF